MNYKLWNKCIILALVYFLFDLNTCLSTNINIKLLEDKNASDETFFLFFSKTGNALNSLIIKWDTYLLTCNYLQLTCIATLLGNFFLSSHWLKMQVHILIIKYIYNHITSASSAP